jgi:hypothetical protein
LFDATVKLRVAFPLKGLGPEDLSASDSEMEQLRLQEYDRPVKRALVIAALMVTAGAARGQNAAPGEPPQASSSDTSSSDTSSIILAPKTAQTAQPAPASAAQEGPTEVDAALAASLPRYKPEPAHAAAEPAATLSDADKPKNQIPRLPTAMMQRYEVRGNRVPVFRERDLYTTEGLIERSFKDHPGLHVGNILNLNAGLAYALFLDEERLGNIRDLQDTAFAVAVGGDPAEAKAIQDATDDTFMRSEDVSGPVHMK